jgi:NAD-dependent DNA ligase
MLIYAKDGSRKLYSRGDGEFGQDISHLVPMIKHIPPNNGIPATGIAVRGELIISKANWDKIRDMGANARNVVAGTMNAKHPNPAITENIDFVAYEMLKPKTLGPSACLDALDSMGFKVMHRELLASTTLTIESLSEILVRRRRDSEYEVDGIVVEHDEIHKIVKGKNPAHAFAFKSILTHDEAEVMVKEVEWNVSGHFRCCANRRRHHSKSDGIQWSFHRKARDRSWIAHRRHSIRRCYPLYRTSVNSSIFQTAKHAPRTICMG